MGFPHLRGSMRRPYAGAVIAVCSVFALLAPAGPAAAGLRAFPEGTAVGLMQPLAGEGVKIGGQVFRLAPGAQIRDTDNRIVLPVAVGSAAKVRYQLDSHGDLWRVWLLDADEIREAEER